MAYGKKSTQLSVGGGGGGHSDMQVYTCVNNGFEIYL